MSKWLYVWRRQVLDSALLTLLRTVTNHKSD